jgi:hypothetical protein
MEDGEKKPGAGTVLGGPQKKIVYAIIAVAVVILAVVLIAKFGYNTDVLNPAGGQMSLVQRNPSSVKSLPVVQKITPSRFELCPLGTTGCSGTCVNTSFDARNCGSCGNACNVSTGGFCSQGTCCYPRGDTKCDGVVCWTGLACCDGRCVPTG